MIFDKFATDLEPKSNFRIERYQLQVPTPDVENVVSAKKKSAQLKVQGAERATSGTTGNKCAEINKYGIGKPSLYLGSSLGAGCHRPRQVRTRYTHSLL